MSRRQFVQVGAGALLAASVSGSLRAEVPTSRRRAPYRLLYGNDTTNLLACVSPGHRRGDPFTPELLKASIDEAAAADAHFLQPGLTFVPLWKSRLYPAIEHFRWWQETFPASPLHELGQFMKDGGDVVQVFVNHCRIRGVAPFISLRVNDYHRLESIDAPAGTKLEAFDSLAVDRFRREHPEYRLNHGDVPLQGLAAPSSKQLFSARDNAVLNWALPVVRDRLLGFVAEITRGYDIAGLELDFLRHFNLFRVDATSTAERARIVTNLVTEVRRELDASGGPRRWLSLRVPAVLAAHEALGLDVAELSRAGVDIFNLSSNYFTVQQDLDVAEIRQRVPDATLYVEMTHCTMVGPDVRLGHGDNASFRRTSTKQFLTTADLQRARGADGVSLFNFAYYRGTGGESLRGPFSEPPFEILPELAAPGVTTRSARSYFLAPAWRSPFHNHVQMPLKVAGPEPHDLRFDLLKPAAGWPTFGWLRLQSDTPLGANQWRVELNGTRLAPAETDSVPHESHPALQGTPETLVAWLVPASSLRAGLNRVGLVLEKGPPVTLVFAEILFA